MSANSFHLFSTSTEFIVDSSVSTVENQMNDIEDDTDSDEEIGILDVPVSEATLLHGEENGYYYRDIYFFNYPFLLIRIYHTLYIGDAELVQ